MGCPPYLVVPIDQIGEYFCHGCGQLRLWLYKKPECCGNCNGKELQYGDIGSRELKALRDARSCS